MANWDMNILRFYKSQSSIRALALSAVLGVLCPTVALAQTFTNTTDAVIGDTTRCGTTNVVRNFTVTGVGTVDDLNVGFLATHSWRGDIVMTLESPAPTATTITLITSDTAGTGNDDDYNILMDDGAPVVINTGSADGPHDVTEPLYEHEVVPNNPLASFSGVNANGTWVMTMCDDFNTEDGTFLEASLIFSSPPPGADLSLNASTADLSPEIGSTITFTYDVSNLGPDAATGVTAQINMPSGLNYVSHTGPGTYSSGTGLWTLPASIASSSTSSLIITATVNPSGPYTTSGEVSASDQADPDSTPNNSSTTEDDDDTLSFVPVASVTPPSLTCPAPDQFSLDWAAPGSTNGWSAGTDSNTYTVGGETISIAMTGNTNRFIARTFGGSTLQTPVSTTQFANGANAGEHGVVMNVDYDLTTESVLTTMNLGTPGIGVGELQFQILDIDSGTWTDRIIVTGFLDGAAVLPILTSSGSNTVSGTDTFLGTGGAATGNAAGNTTVTFTNPVDVVTFEYDNASPTVNPASQVISLQKLDMCPSLKANLSAVKTVEVYDPGALGLYMTPGNEVLYKITVTNSATATADAEDVDITDTLPTNLKFVSATTTGFTGGSFGSPALPSPSQDCAVTACIIRYSGGDVPINTTAEIQVIAEIK